MKPTIEIDGAKVFLGDCRDVLKTLPDNSVDSIVTDPPYELGFMGKKWDSSGIAYDVNVWMDCLRVLKPGGHLLAFGGSRTWHRLAVAVEDAGFELRDSIAWLYGSGFPKSLNIGKKLDEWDGWGTALKPAFEPVVVGRKPLVGTVAENVLEWGVGGLNIDGSRIKFESGEVDFSKQQKQSSDNPLRIGGAKPGDVVQMWKPEGRWPANVILDEVTAGLLDEQSGVTRDGVAVKENSAGRNIFSEIAKPTAPNQGYGGQGGASRFFYVAKASKRDRNEGLEELPLRKSDTRSATAAGLWEQMEAPKQNFHPTVKPTQLMRYLIKLVTPPGGTVLDPFTGSGSTGKAALLDGYNFIGVELTEEYLPIIEGRLTWASQQQDEETLF
jgi:site-specific DNA-methyltransferase (adenine-specific)